MRKTPSKSKIEKPEENILAILNFAAKFNWNDISSIDDVLDRVREDIQKKFTQKVQSLFGKKVSIEVRNVETGSLFGEVLIIGAGIGIYEIIAMYPDFINGLQLLRGQLGEILNTALVENHQQPVRIQVGISHIAPLPVQPAPAAPPPFYSKFFFWYLLVANIFLTGVISWLVYRAVIAVYFSTP